MSHFAPARGVIFDLDGTLLDSIDDLADSMNHSLAQLGFPPHGVAEYKRLVGDGVRELACRSLPEAARTDAHIDETVRLMREEYAKRWDRKTRPYAGIPELLDELVARGMRMAILTNKLHGFSVQMVERLLPRWKFDVILGETEGLPRKPDPAGANRIAHQLSISPGEFRYLGDTNTDMCTATAAGMFPIGVLWGFRDAEELRASGARALLDRPGDLLELL